VAVAAAGGHKVLICKHSYMPDDFSKKHTEHAHRTPTLDFNSGNVWKDEQSQCFVELELK
jgi:hypothetical protein